MVVATDDVDVVQREVLDDLFLEGNHHAGNVHADDQPAAVGNAVVVVLNDRNDLLEVVLLANVLLAVVLLEVVLLVVAL